jgi:glycosyltransferase involved in cell wall biosynthesis
VLVEPTNVDAITEAIIELTTNETLRLDKITDGLVNARRFSWDRTADQVFEVYERVLFDVRNARQGKREMVSWQMQ